MIIYGAVNRSSTLERGNFMCPCCGTQRGYQHIMVKRWFTLYFIPICPVSTMGEYVECTSCAQTYGVEVLGLAHLVPERTVPERPGPVADFSEHEPVDIEPVHVEPEYVEPESTGPAYVEPVDVQPLSSNYSQDLIATKSTSSRNNSGLILVGLLSLVLLPFPVLIAVWYFQGQPPRRQPIGKPVGVAERPIAPIPAPKPRARDELRVEPDPTPAKLPVLEKPASGAKLEEPPAARLNPYSPVVAKEESTEIASRGVADELPTGDAAPKLKTPLNPPQVQNEEPPAVAPRPLGPVKVGGYTQLFSEPKMGWSVKSLAFSPNGRFLAVGKQDRTLYLYDLQRQERIVTHHELEDLGSLPCLAFSPDGSKLIAGGHSGLIRVWDVEENGLLLQSLNFEQHHKEISSLCISADGKHVLSGDEDEIARYWELSTGQQICGIEGWDGPVKGVAFAADNELGLGADGETLLWFKLSDGSIVERMSLTGSSRPQTVSFSPDGTKIVVNDHYAIRMWDLASRREMPRLQDTEIQWASAFSPDSRYVISGGRGKLSLWEIVTNQKIFTLPTGQTSNIQTLAYGPDYERLAFIPSSAGQTLQVIRFPEHVVKRMKPREMREWRFRHGGTTLTARMLSIHFGRICLEQPDGTLLYLLVTSLSVEDQKYISEEYYHRRLPK